MTHNQTLPLGRIVATPTALAAITHEDVLRALTRHRSCDWGDVDAEDSAANNAALARYRGDCRRNVCYCHDDSAPAFECSACGCGTSGRILSAYTAANGARFWIITEADRSVTTILLPGGLLNMLPHRTGHAVNCPRCLTALERARFPWERDVYAVFSRPTGAAIERRHNAALKRRERSQGVPR